MKRKSSLIFGVAMLLILINCHIGWADKTYNLLIIDSEVSEPYAPAKAGLLAELSRLGFVEGKNLKITYHCIDNKENEGIRILKNQSAKNNDIIFLNGTIAAVAAKKVAYGKKEYNFVYACVTDPIGIGLVDNFKSNPKANFTGVAYPVPVTSRIKFILDSMPQVKVIGLVYSEMPQSVSYRRWIEDALANYKDDRFRKIKVIYRSVPFFSGEQGKKKMVNLAEKKVLELDPLVDVFMSPNDQLGSIPEFARMVSRVGSKPLCALNESDINNGAAMAIFPVNSSQGKQSAKMIAKIFEGSPISAIIPEVSKENGFAYNDKLVKRFNIIPNR